MILTGQRSEGVLRRWRSQAAQRHDRRSLAGAALDLRAHGARDDRLPDAAGRGRQRRGLWRRLRDRGGLRFRLRRDQCALCADRSHARHHAGRRRHAESGPRRRRAPRQGADPVRPAVLGRARRKQWGLVNRVVEPAELLEATFGDRRSASPPTVRSRCVRPSRRSIAACRCRCADGLAFEIEAYNRLVPTEDRREGVLAFNEKRKPKFRGEVSERRSCAPDVGSRVCEAALYAASRPGHEMLPPRQDRQLRACRAAVRRRRRYRRLTPARLPAPL